MMQSTIRCFLFYINVIFWGFSCFINHVGLTHCHWQMFLQTQSPHGSDLSESEESMYGKREGVLPGLVVMSNHPKNFYKQTRGFKTGTVMGIQMLARANMVKPESDSWMHVILWIWMFYSLQVWGLMPHWLLEPEPQNTADGKQSCNTPNLHPCLPKSLRWAQASCLIWAERSQTSRSKSKPLVHSLSPGPFTGISLPLLSQSSHSLSLKSLAKVICGTLWFLLTLFPGSCIGHSGCWGHRLPAEDLGSLLCGPNQVANLDWHACIRRVLCTVGCGGWMDT